MRGELTENIVTVFIIASVAVGPLFPGKALGYEAGLLIHTVPLWAFLLWLLWRVFSGEVNLSLPSALWALTGLLLIATFSLFIASHKLPAFLVWSDWLSYAILWWLIFSSRRGMIVRALIASGVVAGVWGWFQYFWGLDLVLKQFWASPDAILRELRLDESVMGNFLARLKDRRAFSTFFMPNTFASFLVLLIPCQLAVVIQSRQNRWRFAFFLLITVVLGGALIFTFSKGGWMAMVVALAVLALLCLRRFWTPLLVAVGLCALLAVLYPHAYRTGIASLGVRGDYWRSSLRMVREHPIAGVGLGNFADNYPRYRLPQARETKATHNDYLQLLAELGPGGLIAFLLFWALALKGSGFKPEENTQEKRQDTLLCLGGGAMAFGLLISCGGYLEVPGNFRLTVLATAWAFVVWCLTVYIFESIEWSRLIVKGLVAGLVGVLFHMFFDFDFTVASLAQSLFVVCALVVVPKTFVTLRPSPALRALVSIALVGILLWWSYSALPRLLEAGIARRKANSLYSEARGLFTSPDRNDREIAEMLREALSYYERSVRRNPWDDRTHTRLAEVAVILWKATGYIGDEFCFRAVVSLKNSIRLSPNEPGHHLHLAELLREMAMKRPHLLRKWFSEKLSYPGVRPDRAFFVPALLEYEKAAELYPANPTLRVYYARALREAGLFERALAEYRKALELDHQQPNTVLMMDPSLRKTVESFLRGNQTSYTPTKDSATPRQ